MKATDLPKAKFLLEKHAQLLTQLSRLEAVEGDFDIAISGERVSISAPRSQVLALTRAEITKLEQELTRIGVEL